MKSSRSSSLTLGCLSICTMISLLFSASDAHALAGGPWSNNSPLSTGSQGTYGVSMSGANFVGVMYFAVSDTTGSTGRFFTFHEGVFSTGDASGFVDTLSNSVTGVFGRGEATTSGGTLDIASNYVAGGWQALVIQPYPSYQFAGTGFVSTAASDFQLSAASDASLVETTATVTDGVTTTETETSASTADSGFILVIEQLPITVLGYRLSSASATFPSIN